MAVISALAKLLKNPKTARFAESLNHADLPADWATDPEIVRMAEAAYKEMGTDSPFFRAWFQKSKIVDDAGKPQPVYHGTNAKPFNVFDIGKAGKSSGNEGLFGKGVYTSTDAQEARNYGRRVMPLYLKSENPENLTIRSVEEYMPDLGYQKTPVGIDKDWLLGEFSKRDKGSAKLAKDIMDENYELGTTGNYGVKNFDVNDIFDILEGVENGNSFNADHYSKMATEMFGTAPKFQLGYRYAPKTMWELTRGGELADDLTKAMQKRGYDAATFINERIAFDPKQLKSVHNRGTFNPDDPNIYKGLLPLIGAGGAAAALAPGQAQASIPAEQYVWPADRPGYVNKEPGLGSPIVDPADIVTAPIGMTTAAGKAAAMAAEPFVATATDKAINGLLGLFQGKDQTSGGGW